jgi:hypothetical protein
MKKGLLIVLLLISAALIWFVFIRKPADVKETEKQQPVVVSKHNDAFNQHFNAMITDYHQMTEAFVNWDKPAIESNASDLMKSIDELQMDDLKKDSMIYETAISYWQNARQSIQSIQSMEDLESKRRSLNVLSDNLYNLVRTVRYDQAKFYWQQCPMAFNDTESGFWLSETDAVRNPYLGTKHPKYGKGMLTCGEPIDTLNFMNTGMNP